MTVAPLAANVLGSGGKVIVFALLALTLSAAANLECMHPPELCPTHLKATGLALVDATSRFGPVLLLSVMQGYGVRAALAVD